MIRGSGHTISSECMTCLVDWDICNDMHGQVFSWFQC